jgi:SAM-dependent methyltransferase
MPSEIGLYDDALVYDILHAKGTAREVGVLDRIERRVLGEAGARRRVWLEPACGTGRYLRAAALRGKRVVGFDRSPGMVEYARERVSSASVRGARLFVADMTRFANEVGEGRVDLAFNLINTIRHLESDRAMLLHLGEMARVLRPRGVYAVGISLSDYGNEFESEDVWYGKRGSLAVRQIVSYAPTAKRTLRWEKVHSHLVLSRGGVEEHRDSGYGLRCYDAGQWLDLVAKSALRIAGVVDEGGKKAEIRGAGYLVFLLVRR